MIIEQIYTGCLAQGAYYIESDGEAAIVDPLREVQPYLEKAKKNGAQIKYILETHFHADFVSGHVDLAKDSGGTIVFGPGAQPSYDALVAEDGQELQLGKVTIKILHTPGHTMESSTFLLINEQGEEEAVFTGDTLFIGDVGRPDLAQKAAGMTQEELAATLYQSLREKIMTLPDDVTVYPGHGAGSACGKNMSSKTISTIGEQKASNYALRADMTEAEFVREVTEGLLKPPAYFPMNAKLNKEGYQSIDEVLERGIRSLPVNEFELAAEETGALIIDARSHEEFEKGFVPQSINIGLDGNFAPWVGALIPIGQPLLLVTPKGKEEETVTRLARIGYDQVLGYLKGGFDQWKESGREVDEIESISAEEISKDIAEQKSLLIKDVRKPGEFEAEHLEAAENMPLDFINDHIASVPRDQNVYLHCKSGYRSTTAISILQARGWRNLINIRGGFEALQETSAPITDVKCSSSNA